MKSKLESFEMSLYRRILSTSWTAGITNVEILRKMKKEMEVISTVKIRKLQYLGQEMCIRDRLSPETSQARKN